MAVKYAYCFALTRRCWDLGVRVFTEVGQKQNANIFFWGSRVLENVSLGRETDLAKISARDSLTNQQNQGFSKKRNSSKNQKIIDFQKTLQSTVKICWRRPSP